MAQAHASGRQNQMQCFICTNPMDHTRLSMHICYHLSYLPYPCMTCNQTFADYEQLDLHNVRNGHGDGSRNAVPVIVPIMDRIRETVLELSAKSSRNSVTADWLAGTTKVLELLQQEAASDSRVTDPQRNAIESLMLKIRDRRIVCEAQFSSARGLPAPSDPPQGVAIVEQPLSDTSLIGSGTADVNETDSDRANISIQADPGNTDKKPGPGIIYPDLTAADTGLDREDIPEGISPVSAEVPLFPQAGQESQTPANPTPPKRRHRIKTEAVEVEPIVSSPLDHDMTANVQQFQDNCAAQVVVERVTIPVEAAPAVTVKVKKEPVKRAKAPSKKRNQPAKRDAARQSIPTPPSTTPELPMSVAAEDGSSAKRRRTNKRSGEVQPDSSLLFTDRPRRSAAQKAVETTRQFFKEEPMEDTAGSHRVARHNVDDEYVADELEPVVSDEEDEEDNMDEDEDFDEEQPMSSAQAKAKTAAKQSRRVKTVTATASMGPTPPVEERPPTNLNGNFFCRNVAVCSQGKSFWKVEDAKKHAIGHYRDLLAEFCDFGTHSHFCFECAVMFEVNDERMQTHEHQGAAIRKIPTQGRLRQKVADECAAAPIAQVIFDGIIETKNK